MTTTLTVAELAERERVAVRTVQGWVHKGIGPRSFLIGRRRRFDLEDVLIWEAEQKAATRR